MEQNLQNLNKAAATNGLIIGIISFILGAVTYYVAPSMMGSIGFGIGMMVISLLIYIFFTLDLRKKIGGFWSFKQAFQGIFVMAFVGGLLMTVVNLAFYKFVEPDAYNVVAGHIESGMTTTFENMGMEQDQIDKAIEEQLKGIKATYDPTLTDFFKNFGIALAIQLVMSLIFAAIFKKEAPAFAPVEEEEQL